MSERAEQHENSPPARPKAPSVNLERIPRALCDLNQWVLWQYEDRDGMWTKVPINARSGAKASATDPHTWSSFDAVVSAFQKRAQDWNIDGIGFVFTASDRYVGIDLDGCIDDNGAIVPGAREIIDSIASYTEVSPSGRGVKLFIMGVKPAGSGCRSKAIKDFKETEIYSEGRYFTVTGQQVAGTPPTVEERQESLELLCNQLWPPKSKTAPSDAPAPGSGFVGTDAELIGKASNAVNGTKFKALWNGDTSAHGDDDSAADLALCCLLAFWTGGDSAWIDRLFRESALYREKWERPDYRQTTIQKAISQVKDYYQPRSHRKNAENNEASKSGPLGVRLVCLSVNNTPSRSTARFEVHVDGKDTRCEWTVTDNTTSSEKAIALLLEIVASSKGVGRLTRPQMKTLRSWARTIVTSRALSELASVLAAQRDLHNANAPIKQTVFEIARPYMKEAFGLAFVGKNGQIWSEKQGRFIDRAEFISWIDSTLLDLIKVASNYPAPTVSDTTKPIKHLQNELKVCWTELQLSLPDEVNATELSAQSKAASAFRGQIVKLWSTTDTWIKTEPTRDQPGHAERTSLAGRARDQARSSQPFKRVLKGVDVFLLVEPPEGSRPPRILLGMRFTACNNQVKGVHIPSITSQADLTILATRYGLTSSDHSDARIREGPHQQRICVLSPELSEQIVFGADNDAQADETIGDVTSHEGVGVTSDCSEDTIDHETGEVKSGV